MLGKGDLTGGVGNMGWKEMGTRTTAEGMDLGASLDDDTSIPVNVKVKNKDDYSKLHFSSLTNGVN